MIELRPEVKEILEKYINLIEANNWDKFFETIQNDWVPQIVGKVANTLESCSIFPLPYMTFIPEGYFYISSITEFVVPQNIQRICYRAFAGSDLEKVHITSNVYDVNEQAFVDCDFLKTVIMNEGVRYIDNGVFYSCTALESVILPRSLQRIGHNVFNGCDNLTRIYYKGTTADWNKVVNREFINEGSYVRRIICSDGELVL